MADRFDGRHLDACVLHGSERLTKRLGRFVEAAHWNGHAGLGLLRTLNEHAPFERRRAGVKYEESLPHPPSLGRVDSNRRGARGLSQRPDRSRGIGLELSREGERDAFIQDHVPLEDGAVAAQKIDDLSDDRFRR